MIVDAFTESLEIGLESPGQVVVSAAVRLTSRHLEPSLLGSFDVAYDPHFRVRMAERS